MQILALRGFSEHRAKECKATPCIHGHRRSFRQNPPKLRLLDHREAIRPLFFDELASKDQPIS